MRITVLGSGTSLGVPAIGCRCTVCTSDIPENRRARSSIFVEHEGGTVLVDCGSDFRYQALRYKIPRIDAVLFTHDHADHMNGIDDLRAYNWIQKGPRIMEETVKITCPGCKTILVVQRRDGKILEVRKPLIEETTGDRFEDAFQKVKGRTDAIDGKVEAAKKKEEEHLKGADDFFKKALERAKESGDEKPFNPLDMQ